MHDLIFEFEWEQVDGSRGDELAATWARIAVRIDGEPITLALDYRSRSVREHLLIPLYPLAEWLATHWWALLYEVETPGRSDYEARHNLRMGREGFALPDLIVKPLGERACIEWRALEIPDAHISFPRQGSRIVALASVRQALRDLIETILARLDQQGVANSPLHQEWRGIQDADADEEAFCIAAARLGRDPYVLDSGMAGAILASASRLPQHWQEDFFATADPLQLEAQTNLVQEARTRAQGLAGQFAPLVRLRADMERIDGGQAPWEQGYEAATQLRRRLGIDDRPLNANGDLVNALGIKSLEGLGTLDPAAARVFVALVDSDADGTPAFLTARRRPEQVRFAFCRALSEYLTADTPSALITDARTDRQGRNRAFAAEFLAPAVWLRTRISSARVGPEEVDEWADALGVSTAVVRHQIENHRLVQVFGF